MSHVDEGTLHAYLDGELPSGEWEAVEAHLAHCATCQATLGEARALLERASALLGSARPLERPAPPFEQLHRAAKRSRWRVRTPVAWAASIMLALGLGYYLRDPGNDAALVTTPAPSVAVAEDRAATPATQPPPAMERLRQEARSQARRGMERNRLLDTVSGEVARADEQPRTDSAAVVRALALRSSTELRNVAPAPAAVAARSARDSLVLGEAIVVRGASGRAASVPRDLVTTQWPIISRGAATSLLGTAPVGLPGLATRQIRRSPAPDATVVVEQALDSSTVIQVFQRPASSDAFYIDGARLDSTAEAVPRQRERAAAPRAAAPARATERLARFVGGLRVEITGPLSTDSLNRLLEQVKPIKP